MERRQFLAGTLAVSGGIALSGMAGLPAQAAAPRPPVELVGPTRKAAHYPVNRAPLQSTPFLRLPPGSISTGGWLREQLKLQLGGLNGRLPEISDFLDPATSGWSLPSKGGWEELPYWLRGFGDLAYVTGDANALEQTRAWIDRILGTRQSDGFFGPTSLRTALNGGPDFWPYVPVQDALRSWHEYSGDERALSALTGWLKYLNGQKPEQFGHGWGTFRCADVIESAYWLYNRTGDDWLLDLVRKVHTHSADYTTGIPNWHNVNLAQGFREPAQYGLLDGASSLRSATYRNYETVMRRYGQFPGGGFAGDENCRSGYADPLQGFESCGIVEYMYSHELLTRMTGDPVWADRCEELALNMLPAALDPQHQGIHYVTSANGVQLDNGAKNHGQFDNDFAMQAYMPGIHNYRCCPHNYGMGWPYYAEELWLASADGGLCASLYAQSSVRAKVGDGTTVTFTEDTAYPFEETITFTLSTPRTVNFPLYLRLPGWCSAPSVRLNGRPAPRRTSGGYLVLNREWQDGDTLELRLPMRTSVRTWKDNNDAVSVDHGPLTYSLQIDEDWKRFAGTEDWPEYEVHPASPWNYALELDKNSPEKSFTVERTGADEANPFTHSGTPVRMRARARRVPAWRTDDQDVITPLQQSPVHTREPVEQVTLIPSAAARLRVTAFPSAGTGPRAHEWISCTASFSGVDTPQALIMNAGTEPASSSDHSIARFTWWDRRGTTEWVQYETTGATRLDEVSVYWFDDTGVGACRVPDTWELLYRDGAGDWKPVESPTEYGTATDQFNRVAFNRVTTTALRLRVHLRADYSGGVLAWRTGPAKR
ncbi:glycoside hydrolase family 127 protein [Streptomyces sp. N2-109]|uniref:Glycoside hydrolase family 127 protein n=1 Tax=Streptomyces gossypii TaxID=2883101 RepID=A0ABT2JQZ2_9ACTN|nr:glycoside hydrolase family 127 protein [Streptomyces gossypii]MCT2590307.1 glycoside hydrolase family 127 protein [Streptomyces gossypii]